MTIENLGHRANERVYSIKIRLSDELLANIDEMKKMWKLSTRSEAIEQLIKKVFMKSENDGFD
jgi:metal-responsive CopG/Arc/MetJ family transcriptional regulator